MPIRSNRTPWLTSSPHTVNRHNQQEKHRFLPIFAGVFACACRPNIYHSTNKHRGSARTATMKIDEILTEMPNLSPGELDAVRVKSHELEVQARKRRLQQDDSEPWPPPRE